MNADYRKGKQMYDKKLQSFNLRSFVLIRVSSDKYYSVVKYTQNRVNPRFN